MSSVILKINQDFVKIQFSLGLQWVGLIGLIEPKAVFSAFCNFRLTLSSFPFFFQWILTVGGLSQDRVPTPLQNGQINHLGLPPCIQKRLQEP